MRLPHCGRPHACTLLLTRAKECERADASERMRVHMVEIFAQTAIFCMRILLRVFSAKGACDMWPQHRGFAILFTCDGKKEIAEKQGCLRPMPRECVVTDRRVCAARSDSDACVSVMGKRVVRCCVEGACATFWQIISSSARHWCCSSRPTQRTRKRGYDASQIGTFQVDAAAAALLRSCSQRRRIPDQRAFM
eukprot:2917392-Pleurochrysis_carterae.AAC.1